MARWDEWAQLVRDAQARCAHERVARMRAAQRRFEAARVHDRARSRLTRGGDGGGAELAAVERRAGVALAHDGDEPHGVTALIAGMRYGLFLIVA